MEGTDEHPRPTPCSSQGRRIGEMMYIYCRVPLLKLPDAHDYEFVFHRIEVIKYSEDLEEVLDFVEPLRWASIREIFEEEDLLISQRIVDWQDEHLDLRLIMRQSLEYLVLVSVAKEFRFIFDRPKN